MLEATSTVPRHISPESHAEMTSSTPADFGDIPPILRWEDDASVELASPSETWAGWGKADATANGTNGTSVEGEVRGRLYVTEE